MALEKRTEALLSLERAWADWVGNPASPAAKGYNPRLYTVPRKRAALFAAQANAETSEPLIPDLDDDNSTSKPCVSRETSDAASQNGLTSDPWSTAATSSAPNGSDVENPKTSKEVSTNRPRPTYRPRWFGSSVDAIEYWEQKFLEADGEVRTLRKTGSFEATHSAFVTFEDVNSAVSVFFWKTYSVVLIHVANGMSSGTLSLPFTSHHSACARTSRCRVESNRYIAQGGADQIMGSYGSYGHLTLVLDS